MAARRIGVIGGGAAGAAVIGELLRHGRGLTLTWVVGHGAPGRGVAYATPSPHHLLNVRAGATGLFADDPGALLRFARTRGIAVEGADFLPRSLFGEFVGATLAREIAVSDGSNTLELRPVEAVAITPSADTVAVATDDGARQPFDAAVLAIGAPPPRPLAVVRAAALASGRYVLDPWSLPRRHPAPQRVLVIGAGLTAIDAMLSAADAWPDAQILAVSRHGRLPARHCARAAPVYALPDALIADLIARPRLRYWLRRMRAAIAASDDWRHAIDGLRAATPDLWCGLDANERRRFLRHVRWAWDIARHRVAPQAAEAIDALRDAGRLELVAGRIIDVDGAAPLHVVVRHRHDGSVQTYGADLVIQAAGFEALTPDTSHPLLRQLLAAGLIRPDALGLGIEADERGRPLRADGTPWLSLHAIGALLRGVLWECTALREISAAAARLARELSGGIEFVRPSTKGKPGRGHNDMSIRQFGI